MAAKNKQTRSYQKKKLVLIPKWVLDTKTDWPTNRRLQHNFDFDFT
jgi:hypothetical protein